MDVENWVKQKTSEGRKLHKENELKFLSFSQPQIILATLYTQAKMGNRELTVNDVSSKSGVPYSTCRSILAKLEGLGCVVKQTRGHRKSHLFKTYIPELEKLIKMLAKNGE